MSRKEKIGLDFYSLDTDLFFNRKIKRLIKNFGGNGYMIYSFVLTEIYRDKGCFIVWDQDTAFDVSDALNVKETLVNEVVCYCCNVGLFNEELRTSGNVLTTKNIQEFWVKVSKGANRKIQKVPGRISLLNEESTLKSEQSTLKPESIPLKPEESTQRKEKESKLKESKEEERECSAHAFLKSNSSISLEAVEMRIKDKIPDWDDFIKNFNLKVDEEELSYTTKVLIARFERMGNNWIKNNQKFGKKSFAKKPKSINEQFNHLI